MSTSISRGAVLVLGLCFVTILADGFDLIVYGATLPSLMQQWGLDKSALANVHSLTLVGLVIGFLVAGPLADRFGRRSSMIAGVAWFSAMCIVCALAPNFAVFGAGRVLSGLGLGAVVPSAVALASEFAPANRRQLFNGICLVGYPIGGVVATVAALAILPGADTIAAASPPIESWRWLYGIGGLLIVLAPVLYFLLPESPSYLRSRGREEEAVALATRYGVAIMSDGVSADDTDRARGVRLLLTPRYLVPTIMFIAMTFCTQILTYGPNTWLPNMIKEMGFGGTQGTLALMMLQIGAAAGALGGSIRVDRGSATRTVALFFGVGAIALLALAYGTELGTVGLFVAAFVTGVGTVGTSTLVYGMIAVYYPTESRSSAIGFCIGIGRFGAILGPQVGALFVTARSGLLAFMIPSLLGAVLVLALAAYQRTRPPIVEQAIKPADPEPTRA